MITPTLFYEDWDQMQCGTAVAAILPRQCLACDRRGSRCLTCEGRWWVYPPIPAVFPLMSQAAWELHCRVIWQAMGTTEGPQVLEALESE